MDADQTEAEPSTVLPTDPAALVAMIEGATVALATARFTAATEEQLLEIAEVLERVHRRLDAVDAALLVEVSDRGAYRKDGYLSLHQYLSSGLRLGDGEARRRRTSVAAIGRFTGLQGQTLPPSRPATADAVTDGVIGAAHVREIDAIMDRIPAAVDPLTREQAEAQLAAVARELTPDGVRAAGIRLLAHLDPDGSLTDERDRKRHRKFALMPQDRRLMSKVTASLTPALRARFELLLGSWAAPGMNNPADPESPRGACEVADPAAVAAAAERDDRTAGQRGHDALVALLDAERALTAAATTGNGRLSSQIVVTVTDKELREHAGVALTATGTRLPVAELIEVAADATPHLAVFSHHTGQALYLGRGRRLASKAQRLMLFARDRGCTAPGCSAPFARTQAHHFPDYADGGPTDVDHLGAACGRHNRSVGKALGDWETMLLIDGPHAGRIAWRPVAARYPRKGWRVNQIHHAELLPDQGPHAPPAPGDSRGQAYLARLIAA
ncbi:MULTISPECIES: HNH endonuclease signature motif containing protein [Gordonia]|uniref:HNH nuclease domain-containing protein n=1 Tax=Gordonia sihwensis NBRC 108236 TaxID=1223544 RepID=L7LP12_9ACTN|nr:MULTISPECIES: HNH endonuclease signature motif containing protein [Gordonia]AUH68052.1 HNH endonuclease [Gordonia sp. YC-JH1]MBY4569302.1 HNH endonuclease [Gordonia sihwensis]GAC61852.1 hypothetical protein GSI01S_25_00030 [Gordonia sihwensis NBRC 108236]